MICKNCGADIGDKGQCPYCDTVYFETIQLQEPVWTPPITERVTVRENIPEEMAKPSKKPALHWWKPTKATLVILLFILILFARKYRIKTIGATSFFTGIFVISLLSYLPIQLICMMWILAYRSIQEETGGKVTITITKTAKVIFGIYFFCLFLIFPGLSHVLGLFAAIVIAICGMLFLFSITQSLCKPPETYQTNLTAVKSSSPKPFQYPYDDMDDHRFCLYCCIVLARNGFTDISVTKTAQNQGIDLIAYKHGIRYGIQCKCRSSNVDITAVQKAIAGKAFFECRMAVILTNRSFSVAAETLADSEDILLWDRDKLNTLAGF